MKKWIWTGCVLLGFTAAVSFTVIDFTDRDTEVILHYTVDPKARELAFYWKNDTGMILHSISNLKKYLRANNRELVFATNGGMFRPDYSPSGLFIEKGKELSPLEVRNGEGNFFLKPNGVFYLTAKREAFICKTEDFTSTSDVAYATQSGPMLLIDGKIHTAFKPGSSNVNIRNGVGILPDGTVLFAMSKEPVNFYDFAIFFKNKGCKNALYLDGFVSRTYLPEKNWQQTDGNFGVMIAVTAAR